MAYQRNPRRRVVRGSSSDELRRGGRRTSEELDIEDDDMSFVRLGSSAIGTAQDVVQRIGDAIIGGDFGGNARGEAAIDIQIDRNESSVSTVPDPTLVASGDGAVAFGRRLKASGANSVALGVNTEVTGQNSVGVGTASVTGAGSTGIGVDVFATGLDSTVIGQGTASGAQSVAIGVGDVLASGEAAVAIGSSATASAQGAIALGENALADEAYETVIRANKIRMQTTTSPANQEAVITTSDAAPVTGNVVTWSDVDRIGDAGYAASDVARKSHGFQNALLPTLYGIIAEALTWAAAQVFQAAVTLQSTFSQAGTSSSTLHNIDQSGTGDISTLQDGGVTVIRFPDQGGVVVVPQAGGFQVITGLIGYDNTAAGFKRLKFQHEDHPGPVPIDPRNGFSNAQIITTYP